MDSFSKSASWRAPVATGALEAVVELPGSKSLSARALLLAAIADAPTTLTGLLRSRDTELMLAALSVLGAHFEDLDETGTHLRVTPAPLPLHVQTGPDGVGRIDVGLAGTVMRFVPALAALADAPVVFDGDEAARRRPMAPLLDALVALGAEVTHLGEPGFLPFRVGPGDGALLRAEGARVAVDGSASSQFVSALLLLGAILPGGLELTPTGPVPSLTHVGMTVATLRERGIAVDEPAPGAGDGERTWRVHPGRPRGGQVMIEPDLSTAGPFLAAALVAGGRVSVPHWPTSTTQAGDAWRELLPRLGGEVELTDGTLTAHGTGRLTGITADLSDVGELAPTVAAFFWNKGGWIQNRAFTLAIWCMFAQCVPAFQDYSVFSVQSVNNPNVNLAVSVIALLANIAAFAYIMYRAKKLKVNPYMNEVFAGTKDYDKAMARRATPAELAES